MLSCMVHYNCSVVWYFVVFTIFSFEPHNNQVRGQDRYYILFTEKELTQSHRYMTCKAYERALFVNHIAFSLLVAYLMDLGVFKSC